MRFGVSVQFQSRAPQTFVWTLQKQVLVVINASVRIAGLTEPMMTVMKVAKIARGAF